MNGAEGRPRGRRAPTRVAPIDEAAIALPTVPDASADAASEGPGKLERETYSAPVPLADGAELLKLASSVHASRESCPNCRRSAVIPHAAIARTRILALALLTYPLGFQSAASCSG